MSSELTISTLPEELRQAIISNLDYNDAWSLKQTSKVFLRVIEIPTIQSFLEYPYGPSLEMLDDWLIMPPHYEACWYCRCLLPAHKFSRAQRILTAGRQQWMKRDYATWKPEEHYCIECGVRHGLYEKGGEDSHGLW